MSEINILEKYSTERLLSMIEYLQNRMKRISSYSCAFKKLSADITPLFEEMARRTA